MSKRYKAPDLPARSRNQDDEGYFEDDAEERRREELANARRMTRRVLRDAKHFGLTGTGAHNADD